MKSGSVAVGEMASHAYGVSSSTEKATVASAEALLVRRGAGGAARVDGVSLVSKVSS